MSTGLGPAAETGASHLAGTEFRGGFVVSIHVAPARGAPMERRSSVRAIPGQGLEGDRYANGAGRFSSRRARGREVTDVTLIASEDLENLAREYGLVLTPEQARRNIVTHGVRLGDLVEGHFRIGEVTLAGAAFCEPCRSLTTSTDPRLFQALATSRRAAGSIVERGDHRRRRSAPRVTGMRISRRSRPGRQDAAPPKQHLRCNGVPLGVAAASRGQTRRRRVGRPARSR